MPKYVYSLAETNMPKIIGHRLVKERCIKKLSQEQVVTLISEQFGDISDKDMSYLTLAAYEQGRRIPSLGSLYVLAKFYDVSIDYLTGLCDDRTIAYTDKEKKEMDESPLFDASVIIPAKDYQKMHGKPVFMKAPDMDIEEGWAILDYYNNKLICLDSIYELESFYELYALPPLENIYPDKILPRPLTYKKLIESDSVYWLEMITPHRSVKELYNGWYIHNESKTALINNLTGHVMPYESIGKVYNLYDI